MNDLTPSIEEIEDNLARNLMTDNKCVRWLLGEYKRLKTIANKAETVASGAVWSSKGYWLNWGNYMADLKTLLQEAAEAAREKK